jgi:hypothetical protein
MSGRTICLKNLFICQKTYVFLGPENHQVLSHWLYTKALGILTNSEQAWQDALRPNFLPDPLA